MEQSPRAARRPVTRQYLRHCPHCGGRATLHRVGVLSIAGYQVVCTDCGCTGRMVLQSNGSLGSKPRTLQQARQEAIIAWNRRV